MSTRFVKWLLQRNLEKMRKIGHFNLRRCSDVKVTRRLINHTGRVIEMMREERASRLLEGRHQLVRGRSAPVELSTR